MKLIDVRSNAAHNFLAPIHKEKLDAELCRDSTHLLASATGGLYGSVAGRCCAPLDTLFAHPRYLHIHPLIRHLLTFCCTSFASTSETFIARAAFERTSAATNFPFISALSFPLFCSRARSALLSAITCSMVCSTAAMALNTRSTYHLSGILYWA